LIGFFYPQTLAFGYGFLQQALYGQAGFGMLLPLAFGKILTTAFSIGSGGSGGVFGPSVVIGGALGACLGKAFHALVPGIVVHPEAFVIVGMAGFFAGVSKAPISTIIMVSEMTGSYLLLLPSMLVCTICYALTGTSSIYSKQAKNRLASPAHQGEFFIDVLEAIKVQDLLDSLKQVTSVPESMRFGEFKQVFARTNQQYFPVANDKGELSGIFSINDFRGVLFESDISDPVTMKDLAQTEVVVTNPTEDLNEVLKKVTVRNLRQIPVVEERNSKRLLGMLDRRDIILFYNQRVEAFKAKGTLPKSGPFAQPIHTGPRPAG
jgi:CIC family chloride channel protein